MDRSREVVGEAIGETVAFGVGVTLSPVAIISVVLILSSPRGVPKASVFLATWVLGLGVVGTLVLLVADAADADGSGAPAAWVGIAKLAVGLLLVVIAARQWSGRPSDQADSELPGWMSKLDGITSPRAAGLALALASVKPKNLLLTVGAGLAIAQTDVSPGRQAIALAVFVLLGTLGPGIPLAIHVVLRDRGAEVLAGLREWMIRENATIIAVLCLAIAAKLLGDAIVTLTS